MRPIFLVHGYDSYSDLFKLTSLAGFGGYTPDVFFDSDCREERDELLKDPEVAFIVTYPTDPKKCWLGGYAFAQIASKQPYRKAKLIHWDIERPDQDNALLEDRGAGFKIDHSVFDVTWVSDRSLVPLGPNRVHVVLGSDARLATDSRATQTRHFGGPMHNESYGPRPPNESYDWTSQSYEIGRREPVYAKLRALGLKEGPNAWGADRDAVLRSSKVMVNVHQTGAPVLEPLRFALAAAYKLPLVSEKISDPYPLRDGDDFLSVPYGDIAETVSKTIEALRGDYGSAIRTFGLVLHETLCGRHTFKRGVEEGLKASFGEAP